MDWAFIDNPPRALHRKPLIGTRPRRVTILLAGVIILSLADLAMTLNHLTTVGMIEANPVAAFLIRSTGSPWILTAFKLLTVGICVSLLYGLRRHLESEVAAWCALVVLVVVSFVWHVYARQIDDPESLRISRQLSAGQWVVLD